jgi:hypothetical protein
MPHAIRGVPSSLILPPVYLEAFLLCAIPG